MDAAMQSWTADGSRDPGDGTSASRLPKDKRRATPLPLESGRTTKRFKCEPCSKGFTTSRALRRHEREDSRHCAAAHVDKEEWPCEECPRVFSRPANLERHRKERHGDGKPPCPRCGKIVRRNAPHKTAVKDHCREQDYALGGGFGFLSDDGWEDEAFGTAVAATTYDSDSVQAHGLRTDVAAQVETIKARHDKYTEAYDELADSITELGLSTKPRTGFLGKVLRNEVRMSVSQMIPCGICQRSFEVYSEPALFKHLWAHFADLSAPKHVCDVCKIAFVNERDLQRHQQSAQAGHCGFRFAHKSVCTGHHPPSDKDEFHRILSEWCSEDISGTEEVNDRDDFTHYIRSWEQVQLQSYSRTTQALTDVGIPRPACVSLPGYPLKSPRSPATYTCSAGAVLAHRPGKGLTTPSRLQFAMPATVIDGHNGDLRNAIVAGKSVEVAKAIHYGADVEHLDHEGNTPLMLAMKQPTSDSSVVWELLFRGASLKWLHSIRQCSHSVPTSCFQAVRNSHWLREAEKLPERSSHCLTRMLYDFLVDALSRRTASATQMGVLLRWWSNDLSSSQWLYEFLSKAIRRAAETDNEAVLQLLCQEAPDWGHMTGLRSLGSETDYFVSLLVARYRILGEVTAAEDPERDSRPRLPGHTEMDAEPWERYSGNYW